MSLLDPTEEVRKILIGLIVLAVTGGMGFVGGCHHKQKEWDSDKLASSEAARKLEKSDNSLGHRKMEQLGEDKITISEAQAIVKKALEGAPKKLVSCGRIEVVTSPAQPKIEEKKDETASDDLPVYLLPDTVKLYDLSVDPSNVGLRTRPYGEADATEVNEGFKVIFKNNFECAAIRSRLTRLEERICEKQKLYKQPISEHCSP